MSSVYVYQAALWCEECGEKLREDLRAAKKAPEDEDDADSGDWPAGPYSEGGGEADSPQHCDGCDRFLANDLTTEGRRCLHEMIVDRLAKTRGTSLASPSEDPMREWIDFYDVTVEDLLDWSES